MKSQTNVFNTDVRQTVFSYTRSSGTNDSGLTARGPWQTNWCQSYKSLYFRNSVLSYYYNAIKIPYNRKMVLLLHIFLFFHGYFTISFFVLFCFVLLTNFFICVNLINKLIFVLLHFGSNIVFYFTLCVLFYVPLVNNYLLMKIRLNGL